MRPDPPNRTAGLGTHSPLGTGAGLPRDLRMKVLMDYYHVSGPPRVGPRPPCMRSNPHVWVLVLHVSRPSPMGGSLTSSYVVRTPMMAPRPPRVPYEPSWRVLDLHVCRSNPHRWVPDLLSYIQTPTGMTQVFRPACALGPHSPLGQGSGAATWPMGTWHKPSTGSKLTARIQTSDCGVSCCAQGIGRLLSGRAGLIDRSSAPHVTDASNCVSAPRAWFAQYDV